jgi:hypothetical protein
MKTNELRMRGTCWVFTLLAEQEGFLSHFLIIVKHFASFEVIIMGLTKIISFIFRLEPSNGQCG